MVFKEEEFPLKVSDFNSKDSHPQQKELRVEIVPNNETDYTDVQSDRTQSEPTQRSLSHGDYKLARDRTRKDNKTQKLGYADLTAYAFTVATDLDEVEPIDYDQAVTCKESDEWVKAMREKMLLLEKNNTWTLVDKPENQKLVGSKWIFKKKEGIPRVDLPRYKGKACSQGVYTERMSGF